MKIIIKMALFWLFVLNSVSANAVIVGDKDWLQVSDTYQSSWNDLDEIFDAQTGKCDVAACILNRNQPGDQIQPLIDLTGYNWASNTEVNELFMSYTDGDGLRNLNSDNTLRLIDEGLFNFFHDFSFTLGEADGGQALSWINGWTRNSSTGQVGTFGDKFWASQFYPKGLYGGRATAFIGLDTQAITVCSSFDCRERWPGAWLFKIVVSEPSAISLFVLAFLGLCGRRCRLRVNHSL